MANQSSLAVALCRLILYALDSTSPTVLPARRAQALGFARFMKLGQLAQSDVSTASNAKKALGGLTPAAYAEKLK